jgi:hypothetical protein
MKAGAIETEMKGGTLCIFGMLIIYEQPRPGLAIAAL